MIWHEVKLDILVEKYISGGTPNTKITKYWDGEIPWITGADFDEGSVSIGRRFVTKDGVENSATNIVPKGSILVVTRTGVGKIALAPLDLAISQDVTGLVLHEGIDNQFVLGAIKNRMRNLLSAQRGTIIKGITRKDLQRLTVPLTSPSEQKRIAEIISEADTLLDETKRQIARVENLIKAINTRAYSSDLTKKWREENSESLSSEMKILTENLGLNSSVK